MSHGPWGRCRATLDPDSLDCADIAQAPIAMGARMNTSAKLIVVFISILSSSGSERFATLSTNRAFQASHRVMQERERPAEMLLVPPSRWIPLLFRDLWKLWILQESKNHATVTLSPLRVCHVFRWQLWNLTWF